MLSRVSSAPPLRSFLARGRPLERRTGLRLGSRGVLVKSSADILLFHSRRTPMSGCKQFRWSYGTPLPRHTCSNGSRFDELSFVFYALPAQESQAGQTHGPRPQARSTRIADANRRHGKNRLTLMSSWLDFN